MIGSARLYVRVAVLAVLLETVAWVFTQDAWAAAVSVKTSATTSLSLGSTFEGTAWATWSYSSRSLTTFGNLVADAWGGASRSVGDLSYVRTFFKQKKDITLRKSSLDKKTVSSAKANRDQVLQSQAVDFESKINQSSEVTKELFFSSAYEGSKIGLLSLKWDVLSPSDLAAGIEELQNKLGTENDPATANTMFGRTAYLRQSWNWNAIAGVDRQLKAISEMLKALDGQEWAEGKSLWAYGQVERLEGLVNDLNLLIGENGQAEKETVSGQLDQTRGIAGILGSQAEQLRELISNWQKYSADQREQKMTQLASQIKEVNQIPGVEAQLMQAYPNDDKEQINRAYLALGVVKANQKLLAFPAGLPVDSSWLELGSVVFKSLLSNPLSDKAEKMPVSFYLPAEVKMADVEKVDDGLKLSFDSGKQQFLVSGDFLLPPKETKIVAVAVKDIWTVNEGEIVGLNERFKAVSGLLSGFESWPYFSGAVGVEKEIGRSLKLAEEASKNVSATEPEKKIAAYHEVGSELKTAKNKMVELEKYIVIPKMLKTMALRVSTMNIWLIWVLAIGVCGIYALSRKGKGILGSRKWRLLGVGN